MSAGGGVVGGGPAPGLVTCQLTLAAAASRPGDTITALLQVSCSQPEAVELQEVEIEFSGIERVDTSWVLPSYRRGTPPINSDKRKVQRYVVQSRLQAATQGTFSDLSLRRFVIRFTLPSWLPPTFRGTAVRYAYFLQAVVKYRAVQQGEAAAAAGASSSSSGGPPPIDAGGAGSVATRVPMHIWPAKHPEPGASERSPRALMAGSSGVGGSSSGGSGSLLSPAIQSEDMPIKCWEIGPGTAVQDAVAHIAKMAAQPAQPSRPHSPGHPVRANSLAGASLAVAAAAAAGGMSGDAATDDSRSEISHDPDELERDGSGSTVLSGTMPPGVPHQAAAALAAQQGAAAPSGGGGSGAGAGASSSGTSTPQMPSRRPSLARPSLDHSSSLARSPSQLLTADSGTSLRSYALRIGDQPLVRVSLHPPLEGCLQPGATLAGTLDFTQPLAAGPDGSSNTAAAGPPPRCMQVLILLETEEIVEAPWRRPVQGGGSGAIRRVYDEHLELTADTACTNFLFTIPPDAAASFQTPLLQLRWLLRFQFIASMPPPQAAAAAAATPSGAGATPPRGGGAAAAADWNPLQGRVEQLTWALPVSVLSPSC